MKNLHVVVLVFLAACVGCRGNENLGQVTGRITLDDEPLGDAFVIFAPTTGGTTSYGRTDGDGRYEMMFTDTELGAWVGENKVEISTGDVDPTMSGAGARERVPAMYNTQSTLLVKVEAGDNEHNFDLKSDDGKVVQPIVE